MKAALACLATVLMAGCGGGEPAPAASGEPAAQFTAFRYAGDDPVFARPVSATEYSNPILAGFFPDPSIVRRDDDYYLATSSFAYAPGVPILHSRNLVDWRLIGHALDRPSQLDFDGLGMSRGIFAPTLRFHDGRFYLVTTAVDAGGNFYVTAEDPAGPWSDPVWLPAIDGIDPDLFFDADGRAWLAHNGPPPGEPLYAGHRAIWLWEFDAEAGDVVAGSGRVIVNGGTDIANEPVWIEAPHLYNREGWYYLLCAEGGTGNEHSAVIFRARSLDGTFEPYPGNPILTQRDLPADRPDPVIGAGHADFVRTPGGDWWAVFLAMRAYDEVHYNTGRETFLLPVTWRDGWPHILPPGEPVPLRAPRPAIAASTPDADTLTGNFTWTDDFDGDAPLHWYRLRRTGQDWLSRSDGTLTLRATDDTLADMGQPAYLARRVQHQRFSATLELALPASDRLSAGLAVFQNATHHFFIGVRRHDAGYEMFLERAAGGSPEITHRRDLDGNPGDILTLSVAADRGSIGFAAKRPAGTTIPLADRLDARILSTTVAGGFIGATLGPHVRREASN